jgi:hypothetical protein
MNPFKNKKSNNNAALNANNPSSANLQKQIELRAYYKSEERGFVPGHELSDWLSAETEISSSAKGV